MFAPPPELASHARVWSGQPAVDLAALDDKRLADYRHPDERRALLVILVGAVAFFAALALVHPSVSELLRWVPFPLARAAADVLHPARAGPLLLLLFFAIAALEAVGMLLRRWDLPYDAVEITPVTFPKLGPVVEELTRRFGLPRTRVFATRTAPLPGSALGVREPYLIVFSTGLLGYVTPDEFRFLLGRQLGHVKLGHTRMALFFGSGQAALSLNVLKQLRSLVFGNYQRAQELSADRIGLLATRDLRPMVSLLIKLQIGVISGAKIDLDSLTPQAAELQGGRDATVARLRQLLTAQPRFVFRLLELTRWAGLPPPPAPGSPAAPAASEAAVAPSPAVAAPAASASSGSSETSTCAPPGTAAETAAPGEARPSAAQGSATPGTTPIQTVARPSSTASS